MQYLCIRTEFFSYRLGGGGGGSSSKYISIKGGKSGGSSTSGGSSSKLISINGESGSSSGGSSSGIITMKEGGSSSSSSIRISSGKKLITIGKKITSGSTSKGSTKQGDPLSITVDQDTDKLAQENLWSGSLLGVSFNGNNMMINNNSRFF